MVLSAIMKLDAGGFTTRLGRATQGVQTTIRLLEDMGGKIKTAFATGGQLSDLAAQTGETAGTLMTLRQAFEDTGIGADKTGQILSIMRRNMAQLNDDGSLTNKMFERLGLSTDQLKNMTASEQLSAIGESIRALKTPADQSAAAMEIFGRSGAAMLTLLKDPAALDTAARSLGGLPALMDRNAAAFDAVDDAIGRLRNKSQGIWAGLAEGLLPLADQITGTLDGIDLTGIGQRIGEVVGTAVELFRSAPLGDLLRDGVVAGLGEAVNSIATMFTWLSREFWKALSTPISYLSAVYGVEIQKIMELISRIPKVGKALGLDGFQAQGFEELRDLAQSDILNFLDFDAKVELVDVSAEKERLASAWTGALETYRTKLAAVQDEANAAAAQAAGTAGFIIDAAGGGAAGGGGAGIGIATDALARIGGFAGGGSRMEGLVERQVALVRDQLDVLRGIRDKTGGAARWALA